MKKNRPHIPEALKEQRAPTMRKFRITFEGEVELEIADELLKSCDTDEWRSQMFKFTRIEQIVEHIAFNRILNGLELGSIDGYADQLEGRVKGTIGPHAIEWDIEAQEIK